MANTLWTRKKPEDTVIADNRGHMVNAYPSDNSASSPAQTMIVNGNGFRAEKSDNWKLFKY